MSTVPIHSEIQLELRAVLEGISHLDTPSLEEFAEQVNRLLAQRKAPHVSRAATELLKSIHAAAPPATLERFDALQKKQKDQGSLSGQEQAELHRLVEEIENLEARRLENMITLARIWDISLEDLRQRLDIKPPAPHVW